MENKAIIIIFGMLLLSNGFKLPKDLNQRVKKEIQDVFEIVDFSCDPVTVPENLETSLPIALTPDNFYKISSKNGVLGYIFLGQAPSKTAKFDYLVIFNTHLEIIHLKIMAYREEYGGEIGSKRWLKQFLGKTGKDRVSYRENIDGIAGATISVQSMTNAMDQLLRAIGMLQSEKILQ
ncbi:MAG: FMN-binding protein [Maribacter sp.]|nr:FMN-binding protein [Maribacter sp.]